jgi:hypothetical protein
MGKLRSQIECLGGHPAVVIVSREDGRAIVSVCLQKERVEPPILADDLDARAVDECGQKLPLLERPHPGPVIEVSTSSPTTSARYVFACDPGRDLRHVDVRLGDEQARFEIERSSESRIRGARAE